MKEFQYCFAVERGVIFEVAYYTLGSNRDPYFTTSAAQFNRPRTDFNQCGQSQKDLLKKRTSARVFYSKYDKYHLKALTQEQYDQVVNSIEQLKTEYPHYIKTDGKDISFSQAVAAERAFRGVVLN